MHTTTKIIFYWLLIGICFILHNSLHQFEIYYGKSMDIVDAGGVLPLDIHIFTILVSISPFILSVLFLNFSSKVLSWSALVWSILFLLLNIAHMIEAIAVEKPFNLSQVVLLSFIVVTNILLTLTLWKHAKTAKEQAV